MTPPDDKPQAPAMSPQQDIPHEPVMIWVVYHPSQKTDEAAAGFASSLHRLLASPWALRPEQLGAPETAIDKALADFYPLRVGIPMRFLCTTEPDPEALTQPILAEQAGIRLVLLLVDDALFLADRKWKATAQRLKAIDRAGAILFRAVAVRPNAHRAALGLPDELYVAAHESAQAWDELYMRLLGELARGLNNGEALEVFLCHTKRDGSGDDIARALSQSTSGHTYINAFYDLNRVAPGRPISAQIKTALARTDVFVAIFNEPFPRQRWPVYETSLAVAGQLPIVIVDAIEGRAPYLPLGLAGAPVVHWAQRHAAHQILAATLETFIIHRVHPQRAEAVWRSWSAGDEPVRTPVGLTVGSRGEGPAIYPEPPRPSEELDRVEPDGSQHYLTLTQCIATLALTAADHQGVPSHCLAGPPDPRRVGLSVSVPRQPVAGYHQSQLDDLSLSLASAVLWLGGALVFGHDLKPGSPAIQLASLVEDYGYPSQPRERLFHYVGWPLENARKENVARELEETSTLQSVTPNGLPAERRREFMFWKKSDTDNHQWWARSMTATRQEMAKACFARIAMGGPLKDYAGRLPGVVEEAWLGLGKPLYLLGGAGGAARAIYRVICDEKVEAMSLDWQLDNSAHYQRLHDRMGLEAVWAKLDADLRALGPEGLSAGNGLSIEENARLAQSTNSAELLYLVCKGLATVAQRPRPNNAAVVSD